MIDARSTCSSCSASRAARFLTRYGSEDRFAWDGSGRLRGEPFQGRSSIRALVDGSAAHLSKIIDGSRAQSGKAAGAGSSDKPRSPRRAGPLCQCRLRRYPGRRALLWRPELPTADGTTVRSAAVGRPRPSTIRHDLRHVSDPRVTESSEERRLQALLQRERRDSNPRPPA